MNLSNEEINILSDTRFLKLKNELSQKIISSLAEIERSLHFEINKTSFVFPDGTFLKAGKISKGEQYLGLPYFILDYPRLFTQKEVFAFRVMLWWGNHFSCTLHLEGDILSKHKKEIIHKICEESNLYFCVNKQPWDYHYGKDNYQLISELSKEIMIAHVEKNGFLKISDFIPVNSCSSFKSFSIKNFARFLAYL